MILLTLFYNPVLLPVNGALWMLLPLCLAVTIVYKTIRTRDIRRLWWEILYLMGYIVFGLVVLCVAAWAIVAYWP